MRLIINASTLSGTGVTQVAVSFIEECKKFSNNTYYVLMSNRVANQIDRFSFPSNFIFYEVNTHPRLLLRGRSIRMYLRKLEMTINPDCIFSVFGPSYWTPRSPHLIGYAYPHYVYPESPIYKIMSLKERIRIYIYKVTHRYFLKKNGSFFVCETEDVSNRLSNYLNIEKKNIYTVSNTYNHFFEGFNSARKNILPTREVDEFRFISLCSFAPNKNLEILNEVIPILNKRINDISIKFVLTANKEQLQAKMSEEAMSSIINLGLVDVSQCPQLYFECDALFLPTLLECFSANYAEAMKMEKPILTSNLSFASTVCQNAALYFDPLDPEDIAEKIILLIEDEKLRTKLINEGIKQLLKFNTSKERAERYLEICDKIKK